MTAYLKNLPAGTPVAVETTGHWYWLLDEIEKAGLEPHLAHALAAKRMMVSPNKTDKLDAKGLATLLRNGTLPEVWVPSGDLRDVRGLMRSRLAARRFGTPLKNRISAALARYGLPREFRGDLFGSSEAAQQASVWVLKKRVWRLWGWVFASFSLKPLHTLNLSEVAVKSAKRQGGRPCAPEANTVRDASRTKPSELSYN